MNKRLTMLMAAVLALLSASGQVEFIGGNTGTYPPIVAPESSTNFIIYVVYDTEGVSMTHTSMTGERAKWYTFDSYPQEITGIQWDGYKTTLNHVTPDRGYEGYIIEDGTGSHNFWVVNYAKFRLSPNDSLKRIFIVNDRPCSLVELRVDGTAPKIPYKNGPNGHMSWLDRQLELSYKTQVWNDSESNPHWELDKDTVVTFASLDEEIILPQPLCDTYFTLTGDYYLKQWSDSLIVTFKSELFETHAVDCRVTAVRLDHDTNTNTNPDNEEEQEQEDDLVGTTSLSAPVHVLFTGHPTEAVAHEKWEIATDADFENVIYDTRNQDELDYTFYDVGTYYVRYTVTYAGNEGTCEASSDIGPISVSDTEFPILYSDRPNVFSPNGDHVNDVWKVKCKSIAEFHCWIFNRWGTLVYEFTDPDGGWDGTYKGKTVDTGVYYYVIKATGYDGKSYSAKGDITIVGYKNNNPSGTPREGQEY